MSNTAQANESAPPDELLPVKLPLSDAELAIAYSMVAALYQLILSWSQNASYDEKAQSIAASAEKLLLRSDVMRRILRITGLERRQQFMVDHIELLEQQKQELLKALRPFAQFIQASSDQPNWQEQFGNNLTPTDFAIARLVYNVLANTNGTPTKCLDPIIN